LAEDVLVDQEPTLAEDEATIGGDANRLEQPDLLNGAGKAVEIAHVLTGSLTDHDVGDFQLDDLTRLVSQSDWLGRWA
jgi:hypothetical protein